MAKSVNDMCVCECVCFTLSVGPVWDCWPGIYVDRQIIIVAKNVNGVCECVCVRESGALSVAPVWDWQPGVQIE